MAGTVAPQVGGAEGSTCCPLPRTLERDREREKESARLFRALGDEVRLGILQLLAQRQEPVCVCEIVANFDLGQPTISYHLKLLREAGLLVCTRRGPWAFYALNWQAVARAQKSLALLL